MQKDCKQRTEHENEEGKRALTKEIDAVGTEDADIELFDCYQIIEHKE